MESTMTQLAQIMNSIVHYQKIALDMLNQFYGAVGSVVVEFDNELKTFASWRSKGIDYLKELETTIAHQWLAVAGSKAAICHSGIVGVRLHRWQLADGNVCIVAYMAGSERSRPTAWCIVLPKDKPQVEKEKLVMLEKLAEAAQVIHMMSKGFLEVASHGVLNISLAETSPWGLIAVDTEGQTRMMNARARTILARNNGILLNDGKVRLLRSSADRTLQSLISSSLQEAEGTDDDIQVVPVPAKDGRIRYAIEVKKFNSVNEFMRAPGAVLLITDFDREKGASGQVLAKVFSLSERESQFAEVFGRGYRIEETAKIMQISTNTARVHLQHVLRKTGTQSQVELAHVLSRLPCSTSEESEPVVLP